jgi:DNA topoisomerase IB
MYEILISLFERAYLLAFEDNMSRKQLRRWRSWEDFMREWCRRVDFREMLPRLLQGEDPDFAAYIMNLAKQEES